MLRILALGLVWTAFLAWTPPAAAAELFAVAGVAVDTTAESATTARDLAIASGRPTAWQRLFRRLTPAESWAQQPQLDTATLQRIIRSFEVVNERRSTTRYLADITYHFNEADVHRILRQAAVPYIETQSRPVLVIALLEGAFVRGSDWAEAWTVPSVADGLVPIVLPLDDVLDQAVLLHPDLSVVTWNDVGDFAARYGVAKVVIANAAQDGSFVLVSEVTPTGRQESSANFTGESFVAIADAVTQRLAAPWKNRAAVDYNQRSRLTTDVQFRTRGDWTRIRTQLGAVKSIADMHVVGLSLSEARVELSYFGRAEQLREAMAQQYLELDGVEGRYLLRLGTMAPAATAAAAETAAAATATATATATETVAQ